MVGQSHDVLQYLWNNSLLLFGLILADEELHLHVMQFCALPGGGDSAPLQETSECGSTPSMQLWVHSR